MIRKSVPAFTLVEVIVSTALITMIFGALVTAAVFVQRSVNAGQLYAQRQAQQLQVSDYLARDLRNAKSVSSSGSVSSARNITIKVPDCYDENGNLREPELDGKGGVKYGTTMKTVVYTFQNGSIRRTSDLPHDEPSLLLAEGLEDFDVQFISEDRTIEMAMTFQPQFSYNDGGPSIRDGTIAVSKTMRRNEDAN